MRASRWAAGLALAAVLAAGCGAAEQGGTSAGSGGGGDARQAAPAAPSKAAGGTSGGVRLVDLGNRIVRTATVDLQVAKGGLGDAITRATDVVTRHKGMYVGSTTSIPSNRPPQGQVTFRVPVEEFEATLRELKGLGDYRGERSSTEDVTNQYIDLKGQLAAWRAQEQAYLKLLGRARSISDVIAVQNQLQQVQSNIERLQGQVNYLEDQSSFSTIVLDLTEPGAGPAAAKHRGTFARAWRTALAGLTAMAAAALVALVWLTPLALIAIAALLVVRLVRRPRQAVAAAKPGPSAG
jgi:Domain of unknown function (DUF4349)